MAIPSQQTIRIGAPNQALNSDSLFDAFTKTQQNFTNLFSCASPYTNFISTGDGLAIQANASTGTVTLQNTGVTSLLAGGGINLSASNGVVVITAANTSGSSGNVYVNITSNNFAVAGAPILNSGTISIDIPTVTLTTNSTSRVTLFQTVVAGAAGYEFMIKGVDVLTGQMNLERLTVVSSQGNSNYSRFGQVDLGASLGTPDVTMIGIMLEIGITPTTTNLVNWTLQYQKI